MPYKIETISFSSQLWSESILKMSLVKWKSGDEAPYNAIIYFTDKKALKTSFHAAVKFNIGVCTSWEPQ